MSKLNYIFTSASPPHLENPCSPSDERDWQIFSSNTQGKSQLKISKLFEKLFWLTLLCFFHQISRFIAIVRNYRLSTYPRMTWTQHKKQFLTNNIISWKQYDLKSNPTWMVKKVSYTGVVTDLVERPGTAVGALWTHRDAEITK